MQYRVKQNESLFACRQRQVTYTTNRAMLRCGQRCQVVMSLQLQESPPCIWDKPKVCLGFTKEMWP